MSEALERRVSRLEDWRDEVDKERGQIMRELGEISTTLTLLQPALNTIAKQVQDIHDAMADRPSNTDFKELENDIRSIRAKAKVPLSEMEILGPLGWKIKLLGFSGITLIVLTTIGVMVLTLWLLRK